jgi:acetyltransferase
LAHPLDIFFEPASVAVVGASAQPGKPGHEALKNLLANGYAGRIYPVNPKGGEILGRPVLAAVADLPQGVDLGIIILATKATPQAIRDCAARGIKALVLAAGGFAEVDDSGAALQEETRRAVQETGVRVLGPNTSGHISTPWGFTSSFFPLGRIPRGPVSYIAQTGNFATHTLRYIQSAERYGVARVIGLGNKVDLDEVDALDYLAQDPETRVIFAYLESFKRPAEFLALAARTVAAKPIFLLKGGSTLAGAQAAVAHTAALASDDRVVDGALKAAGIVRLTRYSQLFQVAKAAAAVPRPRGRRVGFLGPSGAMLVCLTDLCQRNLGLEIPAIAEETRRRLQELSPPFIRMRNPVDIWGAANLHGQETAYREGLAALLADPHIDAAVAILMLTDEAGQVDLGFLPALAAKHPDKPVLVSFSGQKKHFDAAKEFLEPKGVPTYPLIEEPFEVLSLLAPAARKGFDQ